MPYGSGLAATAMPLVVIRCTTASPYIVDDDGTDFRGTLSMNLFSWFKRPAVGAVVVAFDCRGCMGEDHRYMWAGVIAGFQTIEPPGCYDRYTQAVIKIAKRDDYRDMLGADLGEDYAVLGVGSFKKISSKLYFLYL